MNQHQRKYLLEVIEKQYKMELDALQSSQPKEPSLNNYLIAAILDGSFRMNPQDEIQAKIRARVRDLGKSEALVSTNDRWSRFKEEDMISIPVNILFELPPAYRTAKEQYDSDYADWKRKIVSLRDAVEAMKLKVNVGSDKSLEQLVEQADTLCSISITAANKLLLAPPS